MGNAGFSALQLLLGRFDKSQDVFQGNISLHVMCRGQDEVAPSAMLDERFGFGPNLRRTAVGKGRLSRKSPVEAEAAPVAVHQSVDVHHLRLEGVEAVDARLDQVALNGETVPLRQDSRHGEPVALVPLMGGTTTSHFTITIAVIIDVLLVCLAAPQPSEGTTRVPAMSNR